MCVSVKTALYIYILGKLKWYCFNPPSAPLGVPSWYPGRMARGQIKRHYHVEVDGHAAGRHVTWQAVASMARGAEDKLWRVRTTSIQRGQAR